MATDTTRKAVNLAAADARRAIEALQEQSISLQRELAEARAACRQAVDAMRDYPAYPEDADADKLSAAQRRCERVLAPAPSDVKGEEPAKLTPLTDPSVRGVLVDDGELTNQLKGGALYINGDLLFRADEDGVDNSNWQPVKLRPASEFAVPAEPAQKLVPLPEGAIVYVPTGEPDRPLKRNEPGIDENGDIWLCECDDDGTSGCSWKPARRVDTALYGVPAERAWDQTELHKAQCESIGLRAEVERQSERIASLTSAAETAEAEAERLRKAIEHLAGECDRLADSLQNPETTKRICAAFAKTVADDLRAALTPPTAASGEPAMECLDKIGEAMTASAPAAESDGGDGWQSHKIHFDAREMAALESLAEGYGHTTWPDAIVRCKAERDSLSARLAACEERCKELEGNRKGGIDYDS